MVTIYYFDNKDLNKINIIYQIIAQSRRVSELIFLCPTLVKI